MADPIVIAGAGLSGLSLAVHLLEADVPRPMVILEPRTAHVGDRSWCFFDTDAHPFQGCVSHRWSQWRVRAHADEHVVRGSHHTYQHLPAHAFYDHALRQLEASPSVSLRRGVHVVAMDDRGDHVRVRTSDGSLRASVAFDSRPPPPPPAPPPGEVRLLQHFAGWVIRTARPAFDPTTCTLMDFHGRPGEGIHFTYVLPFSASEALVEDTWFTGGTHPEDRYHRELADYIARHVTTDAYQVLRTERGVIPMTTEAPDPAPAPRIRRIGLAGGLAKPSTGYAFVFVQRHSRALARAMRREEVPVAGVDRSAWTRMLDRVFLWVLRERPDEAPELFLRLFRDSPPDALVRFLSEASSVADDLAVMRTLPVPEFTAAAWKSRRLWMRRD